MPKKLLYFGTWDHIDPVIHFPLIKEFVFIDTQPRSEFDRENIFETCFYRHKFYDNLVIKCKSYDFILNQTTVLDPDYYKKIGADSSYDNVNPTLLTFYNYKTKQTIKYYISTNILYNMCPNLEYDIMSADGLILSGYHPNEILFSYISPKLKTIYCYTGTCYDYVEYYKDNIMSKLHFNNLKFNYMIVSKETGEQLQLLDTINMVNLYLDQVKTTYG
jgi:hypothetical protein